MAERYFLKFVSKQEYAEDLVKGYLFARPAGYYADMVDEGKQGMADIREGAVSQHAAISMGKEFPIFCLSTVFDEDTVCENGSERIRISRRMMEEFWQNEEGRIVVIPAIKFRDNLRNACMNKDGRPVDTIFEQVNYGRISPEKMAAMLLKPNCFDPLYIKQPEYAYQKEARICFGDKQVRTIDEKASLMYKERFGEDISFYNWDRVVCIYKVADMSDYAKIYEKKDLHDFGDAYWLIL